MKTSSVVSRAVGTEYIARKYKMFTIIAIVTGTLLVIASIYGVIVNTWWLLLVVPIFILIVAAASLVLGFWFVLSHLRPKLQPIQQTAVSEFVDKLERTLESVQTPLFIILFRLTRDIVRPRNRTYIGTIIDDSTSLRPDFIRLHEICTDKR